MKVGIVIHGPEVVDSGQAGELLSTLRSKFDVFAVAVGTMCRVAVREAALQNVDVSRNFKPSEAIGSLSSQCDYVVLLNTGKTIESGTSFGKIISSRISVPFIQIERPGLADGKVIARGNFENTFPEKLSSLLQMPLDRESSSAWQNILREGNRTYRKVAIVLPGELIMVNGIVVGRAFSEDVALVFENGFIVDIVGAEMREHGVEKVHGYDLLLPLDEQKIWVKSGPLRCPVSGMLRTCGNYPEADVKDKWTVLLIDHNAERLFDRLVEGYDAIVTVGDDTTLVASEILSGYGIPLIGITDGDRDDVMISCRIPCRSTIFRLKSGNDDTFGKLIRTNIFLENDVGRFSSLRELEMRIIGLAGNLMEYMLYF
ncbi:hypothetical protein J2755_000353 [Methanohalophilus levihalophilus]|uniref:DUF2117 domain-containing protein n=1 Tax=Methanohalophilus levihalophilus TaxID=1431282 RepID=UPI001AE9DFAA|nr:hypothetical protein [Methanohalophilus levihalophilus]